MLINERFVGYSLLGIERRTTKEEQLMIDSFLKGSAINIYSEHEYKNKVCSVSGDVCGSLLDIRLLSKDSFYYSYALDPYGGVF